MNFSTFLQEDKQSQQLNVSDVMSRLKAAEQSAEHKSDTKGFVLEDKDGKVVKVRVRADQADDFERAASSALEEIEEKDTEIAEVLFNLKSDFDIVDVDWGDSIPEDEEGEPVDNDVEGPDGEFPGGENPQQGGEGGPGLDGGAEGPGSDDAPEMSANDTDLETGDDKAMSALEQIIDLMKADAEARRIEAEARKAEASVSAGKVAAQAAAARAKAEEEILDMENFNKRKKEEKRQRDLQAKLLRYRHESTKNNNEGDLDMMGESQMYHDATPEEEEILDMEAWEEEENAKKKHEKTRERLNKYRYAKKHKMEEEEQEVSKSKFDLTFKDYKNQLDVEREESGDIIDLSHRAQY